MNRLMKKIVLKIPYSRTLYRNSVKLRNYIKKPHKSKVCAICGNAVLRYNPLPDYYFEEARKHGRSIYKSVPETLNRVEYICPVCGAADRDRLYALYIKKYFAQIQPTKEYILLDIAPAYPLSNYIKSHWNIDYRSMDLFMEGVTYKDDLTNITSIGNDEVDFIICSHVLEHVYDDKKALSEIYRILKPNGRGIIMVPIDLTTRETDEDIDTTESERWRRFGQGDHVRKYAKEDFLSRLRNAGFHVRELGMEYFGMEEYYRSSFIPSSMLYVVEKPNANGNINGDAITGDNKYYSCQIIAGGGVDFTVDNKIRVCCYTRDATGIIADIPDEPKGYDGLVKKITMKHNEIIESFSKGKIYPACEGCVNLFEQQENPMRIDNLKINTITLNHYLACNLKCIYCHRASEKYDKTKHEETDHVKVLGVIKFLIENAYISDTAVFQIGGGEPSISSGMIRIIEYLVENKQQVYINTNATKYVDIFAYGARKGLITIRLTVDAGLEETFQKIKRAAGFNAVWENVGKYMQNTKNNVTVRFILMPENVDDIDNMVSKCKEFSVRRVMIDLLLPGTNADVKKPEDYIFIEPVRDFKNKLLSAGIAVERGYFMPENIFY